MSSSIYSQQVVAAAGCSEPGERPACPACGCCRFKYIYEMPGTRFGIENCLSCGLGRMTPSPTAEEIRSFYPTTYYGSDGAKFGTWTERVVRFAGRRRIDFLNSFVSRGARVLDVGCGRGVIATPLAAAGCDVTGLEMSLDAVNGIDERVKVVISDGVCAAGFPEKSFDLAVIWHVLEHLPDPAETLAELHRVLRNGAHLVVAVPNYSSWQAVWAGPFWFHLDPPRHLYHFSVESLLKLLRTIGFEIQQTHHFSLRQNPFGWLQSLQNKLLPARRNLLYRFLLKDPSLNNMSRTARWMCSAAYCVGMTTVLPLSIVAAIFRSGGTVHVVARKP